MGYWEGKNAIGIVDNVFVVSECSASQQKFVRGKSYI